MMPTMAILLEHHETGSIYCWVCLMTSRQCASQESQTTVLFLTSVMNIRHVIIMSRSFSYWQTVLPLASQFSIFQRITTALVTFLKPMIFYAIYLLP